MGLTRDLDHDPAAVVGPGDEPDIFARKPANHRLPGRLVGRIDKFVGLVRIAKHAPDDPVAHRILDRVLELLVGSGRLDNAAPVQGHRPEFGAIAGGDLQDHGLPVGAQAIEGGHVDRGVRVVGVRPTLAPAQPQGPLLGVLVVGHLGQQISLGVDGPIAILMRPLGALDHGLYVAGKIDREQSRHARAIHEGDAFGEHHGLSVHLARHGRAADDVHHPAAIDAAARHLQVGIQERRNLLLGDVEDLSRRPLASHASAGEVGDTGMGFQDDQVIVVGPDQAADLLVGRAEAGDLGVRVEILDHHPLLSLAQRHVGQSRPVRREPDHVHDRQRAIGLHRSGQGAILPARHDRCGHGDRRVLQLHVCLPRGSGQPSPASARRLAFRLKRNEGARGRPLAPPAPHG